MAQSVRCPQCGTPIEFEVADDGRVRTLGCLFAKRPGHGELTGEAIVAAIDAAHPVLRGVRFQPAPKALKDRWPGR
jgi:uncharacterized OB-fold protein